MCGENTQHLFKSPVLRSLCLSWLMHEGNMIVLIWCGKLGIAMCLAKMTRVDIHTI